MKTNQLNRQLEHRPTTSRPLCWCALTVCLAALWTACKPQPKNTIDAGPVGQYTLVSVDGQNVPCAVKHDGAALTIKSGTFVINADGTCSSLVNFTAPTGSDASREVKATYTRDGVSLTMKWEGAGMTTGKVEGNTFTMNNEGMVFAYTK